MRGRKRERGFSLVEMMVALTLGLIISVGMLMLFLTTRQSFTQDELLARMQDDARFALGQLLYDTSMAGLWGKMIGPGGIANDPSLTVSGDCGASGGAWAYVTGTPIRFVDNATVATAHAGFDCIAGSEIESGTDIIAIQRVAGMAAPASSLTANGVYLQTNSVAGVLFHQGSGPAAPVGGDVTYWRYTPSIYFIRNYGNAPGDHIPTLCRKVLTESATPRWQSECIAQGIEDLQVEYGIDSDALPGSTTFPDGVANVYLPNPDADHLNAAVAARLILLIRSISPDPEYRNRKTYTLSNSAARPYTPNDHFYRRVYGSTVLIRNPAYLRTVRSR